MSVLFSKFKEVLYSVLPITVIVMILNFTIAPLDISLIVRWLIGAVLVIIGLSIFLFGVDNGITPIGNAMGSTIVKTNKLWIVIIAGLILGFFIFVAEPDLQILAGQVDLVSSGMISTVNIVIVVSIGIGAMLALGFVDKGKAEYVIDAATKAGSTGGTIINARGSGIHETSKLFSMDIEPEKEIVMILSVKENTEAIVNSIREKLKIDEPGKGILYIQDVNKTYGLYK